MLVVRIEVWPGGDETTARSVAQMRIANISNLADFSNYEVGATEKRNPLTGAPALGASWKIKNHKRKQTVYALVAKAAVKAARTFNKKGGT